MAKDPYYQHISKLGKEAMWRKKAAGETMHLAPLGYKNVRRNGRSVMVRDRASYGLVCKARRLYRKGKSIRKICYILEQDGLRSHRGNVIGPSAMLLVLKRTPSER